MTNSSESTGTFRKKITSADASNVVSILDMLTLNGQYQQFEEDFILGFAGMLESLQVSVGLWSLKPAEFPQITALMSEAQKQAELFRVREVGQKMSISFHIAKGNGPWEYVSECVLMNQGNNESYVNLLVPFLTANEVLLIDRDFRLGVKIESKWQGALKSGDYLVISGSWRQRVTFTAKKNESEVIAAKVEALELALYGKLTGLPANSLVGSVAGGIAGVIPFSSLPLPTGIAGDNVAIKIKRLSGTTSSTQEGYVVIYHGLPGSKVIACTALVRTSDDGFVCPNHTDSAGFQYDLSADSAGIYLINKAGNSINILSRPIEAILFYIE